MTTAAEELHEIANMPKCQGGGFSMNDAKTAELVKWFAAFEALLEEEDREDRDDS